VEDGDARGGWRGAAGCFNGATPMKAWKTLTEVDNMRKQLGLQWSHADEGVEDGQGRPEAVR